MLLAVLLLMTVCVSTADSVASERSAVGGVTAQNDSTPVIFWSAVPVLPGETAFLQGWGWAADPKQIRIRCDWSDERELGSIQLPVLNVTETSLRFVIPEDWKRGVYHCQIQTPRGTVEYPINLPQPWWFQTERGQTGVPGGWLRIFGRCLELIPGTARVQLRRMDAAIDLTIEKASMWDLLTHFPKDVPAGEWQVWVYNGSGGDRDWVLGGTLQVRSPRSFWPERVFEVSRFGAIADDDLDDSEAFEEALQAIRENGGGILHFGRGRFRLSRSFALPAGILIRGEGAELTHLVWTDAETPPDAFLSSTEGQLGLQDLSVYAHNYQCGLLVEATKPIANGAPQQRAANVLVQHVRFRFTPQSTRLTDKQRADRRKIRTRVLQLNADRVSVLDCDFAWHSHIGFSVQGSDIVCSDNRCHAQEGGWCPVGGGRRVIVENNEFTGITTGVTRGAQVWFAGNLIQHQYSGFREGFTTDGTFDGPGFLNSVSVDGRHVRFESARARTGAPHVPAALRILEGTGRGLVQRIESFDADLKGFTLAREWLVQPDASSVLWAANEMGQYLICDNEVSDTGIAIQLYGSAHDCVVANNSSQRSGGFRVKGNWTCNNVMFLGNQILEGYGTIGPEANAGSSSVNVEGPYVDGFKGVTARGFVLRGNQLENASQIFIRGSVHDVLIERNEIRNTRRGIFADQSGRQQGVLVRENAFDNVENPLEPPQPETWDVRK